MKMKIYFIFIFRLIFWEKKIHLKLYLLSADSPEFMVTLQLSSLYHNTVS